MLLADHGSPIALERDDGVAMGSHLSLECLVVLDLGLYTSVCVWQEGGRHYSYLSRSNSFPGLPSTILVRMASYKPHPFLCNRYPAAWRLGPLTTATHLKVSSLLVGLVGEDVDLLGDP